MPQIQVNGVRLSYSVQGSGEPVVFVHPSFDTSQSWRHQREALRRHYQVITFDRRGYGRSERPPYAPGHTMQVEVADVLGLLDGLGIARAALAGASIGATVALAAAIQAPERIRTVVLGEPSWFWSLDWTPRAQVSYNWAMSFLGELTPVLREQRAAAFVERLLDFTSGSGWRDQTPPRVVQFLASEAPQVLAEYDAYAAPAPASEQEIGGIQTPVLLLESTGKLGLEPAFHAVAATLARRLPRVEHQIVPDSDHLIHLSQPARYNELVLEFLARHGAGGPA